MYIYIAPQRFANMEVMLKMNRSILRSIFVAVGAVERAIETTRDFAFHLFFCLPLRTYRLGRFYYAPDKKRFTGSEFEVLSA